MIPQLNCTTHQHPIQMIDISQQTQQRSRLYCLECLEIYRPQNMSMILKIPGLAQQYASKQVITIMEEYEGPLAQLHYFTQTCDTLKQNINEMFDNLITQAKQLSNDLDAQMQNEQEIFSNLHLNINQEKLEEIAQYLSGDKIRQSQCTTLHQQLVKYSETLALELKKVINIEVRLLHEYESILSQKLIQKNQIQQKEECKSLTSNQEKQIIVGGVGKDIIIWEQQNYELIQSNILIGHTSDIKAIVIYNAQDLIASAGGYNDRQLILWQKINDQWKLIQIAKDSFFYITDLKLSNHEDQLISACSDKCLRIWMNMKVVQKLEHKDLVFYFSISPNQQLATSCEKFINIFKRQLNSEEWQNHTQIQTTGNVKRIHYTAQSLLICQFITPPKLIVYKEIQGYQSIQEISLNQSDDNYILFPIFQNGEKIYIKNDKYIYVIKETQTDQLYIKSIVSGQYYSGCADITRKCIIVSTKETKKIEIYHDY